MNPDLDLTLRRTVRAPRMSVWNAWTDADSLVRWWLPAPSSCRVERLEVSPGGAFVTRMSDDGEEFVPHLDACFWWSRKASASCSRTPSTAACGPPPVSNCR